VKCHRDTGFVECDSKSMQTAHSSRARRTCLVLRGDRAAGDNAALTGPSTLRLGILPGSGHLPEPEYPTTPTARMPKP
jgi:hypothetical protein